MAEANRLGDSEAYLGPGIKINGKLQFDGPARIEGEIEGEIIAHASVMIGRQATMKGKISAVSVLVQGKVIAEVQAEKKLQQERSNYPERTLCVEAGGFRYPY